MDLTVYIYIYKTFMRAFAGGGGTKHECHGRERDQIRYISAGAGQNLVGLKKS